MTDTPHTAAQGFNFDAFMYGVRRDSPFDGSTLADSISNDEVRRAESAFNSLLKRAEKAEAEIAALKGDQVPVAWIRERIIDKPEHKGKVWRDISYPAQPEPAEVDGVYHDVIIPLYDRPQKPVVLLNSSTVMSRAYVVKQIEAAGGIVKDGK